jgi:leader peptidase (prepilin peptidase)/N-methyltransferase
MFAFARLPPTVSGMNLVWAAGGALAGLPAGAVLRGTVFELSVPAGTPARASCPHCAAPVQGLLLTRCRRCRQRLGPSLLLELATASVLGLLVGRFGGHPETLAFCFLGTLGVTLAAIDLAVGRLPGALVLPAYPVLAGLLGVAALMQHDGAALVRAVLGGLALAGGCLLLAVAGPGPFSPRHVTLAGLAGLALAWVGWPTLFTGAVLGLLLFAVASFVLVATRLAALHGARCFGPFLLGGALLAIVAAR